MALPGTELPSTLVLVAGATAVGKSEVALRMAQRLGGEIISVDSMQVYRGMDIGTAKPTQEQRRAIRHHLVDVAGLTESFDVARFVALATAAARDIASRGGVPIGCGGTGLYFKGLLEGMGWAPPAEARVRRALEALPLDVLLRELEMADPVTWGRIDRNNKRRVVRALEVVRLSGQPFSQQRAAWGTVSAGQRGAGRFFVLRRDPSDLRARIDARVERMFEGGLVEETVRLLEAGLAENPTAMQAIGYRQVVEHLRGMRTLAETIDLVKRRTHHFAKRQMTWFRNQTEAIWLDVGAGEGAEETAGRIAARLAAGAS